MSKYGVSMTSYHLNLTQPINKCPGITLMIHKRGKCGRVLRIFMKIVINFRNCIRKLETFHNDGRKIIFAFENDVSFYDSVIQIYNSNKVIAFRNEDIKFYITHTNCQRRKTETINIVSNKMHFQIEFPNIFLFSRRGKTSEISRKSSNRSKIN